jgi:hypothetical protein
MEAKVVRLIECERLVRRYCAERDRLMAELYTDEHLPVDVSLALGLSPTTAEYEVIWAARVESLSQRLRRHGRGRRGVGGGIADMHTGGDRAADHSSVWKTHVEQIRPTKTAGGNQVAPGRDARTTRSVGESYFFTPTAA